MATRSTIWMVKGDTAVGIYCHWDGYPKGVGAMLKKHYTTQDKVEALMALGAISSLKPSIEATPGHTFDSPVEGCTVAYHRDRGDELMQFNAQFVDGRLLDASQVEQYTYVFNNGKWTQGKVA